jgi:3-(3-hydroxy-phenyl)propionate hydroxylase
MAMASAMARTNWRDVINVWEEKQPTPLPLQAPNDKAVVVIVGTGPVGLALALDLGQKGHPVVVLGRFDFVPAGSKAICFAKRSLDILDQLGIGEKAVRKGVVWNTGKVFWKDQSDPIYQFDMQLVKDQKMPGFINIQQYYMEQLLLEKIAEFPNIEVRWGHDVVDIDQGNNGAALQISVEGGEYALDADWVVACDGSKSSIRTMLGLDFEGRIFEDNFLIADIKLKGERPAERWFWFDPPFNPGQSVLLHRQPDDVLRLDFQLGWNIDREACVKPENVDPLIRAMLGSDVEYSPEWYSVYTFQCRRMARFVHDSVIFAGDSAHLVSPFGARGCNGGLADAYNLGWKLDLVLKGEVDATLLESYNDEAIVIADENILNSSRSTDFLTPKSKISEIFRDAVLELSTKYPFARPFVNSGRLSTAISFPVSSLNTADKHHWSGGVPPGSPAVDAPLADDWLLEKLNGAFHLLCNGLNVKPPENCNVIDVANSENVELLIERYDLLPGRAYLIRPDQYVAARFVDPSAKSIQTALAGAKGQH